MRPRCLVAATFAIVLFSGICRADSVPMDNFVYRLSVYTLSFTLPASPTPLFAGDTGFILEPDVSLSIGGILIPGADGKPTIPFELQVFSEPGDPYRFWMSCGEASAFWDYCGILYYASLGEPVFSGTFEDPTFIPGNYDKRQDGGWVLSITPAPEPAEPALTFVCVALLVICFRWFSKQARKNITMH
jgi:hypothetical protein